jgi:sporulation protein YlmC with PRC-barrel domain
MKRIGTLTVIMMVFFIAASVFAAGTGTKTSAQKDQPMQGQDQPMQGKMGTDMGMIQASNLMDKNITNNQGEELGEVKDFIIGKDGKISHLVISRGGVLGVGEDLIPIPWSAAQVYFQQDQLIVNVPKARLEQAPSFSSWDEFFSPGHQEEVRGYYGEEGTRPMGSEPHPGKGGGIKTQQQEGTTPKSD